MPRTADLKGLDEVCIQFLTQQKHSTQATYKCFLKRALEFTGMTGQQLLESKKADKDNQWEKKVIDFKQWLKEEGYSDNATKTAINTLRSFFECYRTPLLFSQSENRKLNGRAQRVTKDYELTNDDISKMNLVGDLREKYILLLGKSFGLRVGDFTALTYGAFRSIDLNQEPPIPIGEIQTEKEGVIAYPFIDSDSLPIVKAVLDCNKNKANTERIITVQEAELSSILQTLADKADINLGGKHLRFHCLRKYLITRLSATMSESKWKQIVGKSTPEEAYVNRFDLRECYLKAMELTTIHKNGNVKISKLSEQVTELNKQVSEQITQLSNQIEAKDKELAELKKRTDLMWNEFSPMYSVAGSSNDPDKVDEEVESFIKLLKETDDEQAKNLDALTDHIWTKKDLPSNFKIEPYISLFDELKKELYRIKNQVKDERERMNAITLENEANNQKTKE